MFFIYHPICTWFISYFKSACILLFLVLPFLIWVAKTSSLSSWQFLELVQKVSLLLLLDFFFLLGLCCMEHTECLLYPCINVFFWLFGFFFSSGCGSFLVLSAPWHAGSSPRPRAQVWALAEVRGTCSGGSKSHVPSGRHSEHVEPSRPCKPTYRLEECPAL